MKLNFALYHTLREQYGLRSQITQSTFKTILAKYQSVKSNGHPFTRISFSYYEYDLVWNRNYANRENIISLNSSSGRLKIPFESKGMEHWFTCGGRFGTAKLIRKSRGKRPAVNQLIVAKI